MTRLHDTTIHCARPVGWLHLQGISSVFAGRLYPALASAGFARNGQMIVHSGSSQTHVYFSVMVDGADKLSGGVDPSPAFLLLPGKGRAGTPCSASRAVAGSGSLRRRQRQMTTSVPDSLAR